MPETLTISMVAQRVGVTYRTLYNWMKTGRFIVPPIEGTKPRRWRRTDIDAWLNTSASTSENVM